MMPETATYTWSDFNTDIACNGMRVGFQQTESSDLSMTGILIPDKTFSLASHKAVINGRSLWINNFGQVVEAVPDAPVTFVGRYVKMVTCEMATSYGTSQAITRGVGNDAEKVATLSSMEPRDQFALCAMQAIMHSLDEPQNLDDANILFYCRAAYRWAQGMMIASADARAERKKQDENGGEEQLAGTRSPVDTSSGTDTEKLLGNIVASLDDLTKQIKVGSGKNFEVMLDNARQEIEAALADRFDPKGSANQALFDAKAYTDSRLNNQMP